MITEDKKLKEMWCNSLMLNGFRCLEESMKEETRQYLMLDSTDEVSRLFGNGTKLFAEEWREKVKNYSIDNTLLTKFYSESKYELFDLMNWHLLNNDDVPLNYVVALTVAKNKKLNKFLDFGSGVGSGGILFAMNGFEVSLADISESLLKFCKHRFKIRRLNSSFIDLREQSLAANYFDVITIFDVLEHSVEPLKIIDRIYGSLKLNGLLIYNAEFSYKLGKKDNRPMHIAKPKRKFMLDVARMGYRFFRVKELGNNRNLYFAIKTSRNHMRVLLNIIVVFYYKLMHLFE